HVGPASQSESARLPRTDEQPIRATFANREDFGAIGAALARRSADLPDMLASFNPRARSGENGDSIRRIARLLGEAQQAGEALTPAADWLLDNAYLVDEAIAETRRDLPDRFYRQLPLIEGGKVPRALAIAW